MNMYCVPKTVFILGAGASVPYGLPTGEHLRSLILNGSPPEFLSPNRNGPLDEDISRLRTRELDEFLVAFRGTSLTIDQFMFERSGQSELGKKLIAHHLLPLEYAAISQNLFTNEWMKWLFQRWHQNQTLFHGNVEFITFNYDRIVEIGMQIMMANAVAISYSECSRFQLFVHHMYGALNADVCSSLALQRTGSNPVHVSFQRNFSRSEIEIAAASIRLMPNDRPTKSSPVDTPALMLRSAERIVFLGFGFNEANISALGFPLRALPPDTRRRIIATGYGMNPRDRRRAIDAVGENIEFPLGPDKGCEELCREVIDWL
jgi:hypothetical protein